MENGMLPKSLHTVRVLALVANDALANRPEYCTPEAAIGYALRLFGYGLANDPHGIVDKVRAQVLTARKVAA